MQVRNFNVLPKLPERLAPLKEIAYNLWFSWNWEAVELFMRLGDKYWLESYQNPVRMLGLIPQEHYQRILSDDSFLASMDRIHASFRRYMQGDTWFKRTYPNEKGVIAYFSCEYGIDEGLPVYSGGLGILSGDHMKSASDLGLPLYGVGLLYREGYFRQYLNADGYQQEEYPENDWYTMPVNQVLGKDGKPIKITVEYPDEKVTARVWKVQVGRVNLILLDTNIPENSPKQREVTAQLYGGDRDMRIRQEILLGIGGLRALWAMGVEPNVCHMNEGHSAFMAVERIAKLLKEGLTYEQASEVVWASNVFTTHTPVPAGNERFDVALVQRYMQPYLAHNGIAWEQFLGLGRENPQNQNESFCMTVLALKLAAHCNGVARLHGEVSRHMWKNLWPGLPEKEVPIGHVTNGINTRTWLSHDMASLFLRYLGPRFVEDPTDFSVFDRIDDIPDAEIWRTHERRRERLVHFARLRTRLSMLRRGARQAQLEMADEILDPEKLTIGFARRFATYKRGTLLFHDMERLSRIINNEKMPVQLIFAGKSHPHDEPGKALIREIVHHSRDDRFQRKIIFLEDYDINVARYLTQGVDVWLNTPLRPLEASGTSGMKAAINGALNVSVLDGWWDEGCSSEVGWAIGSREEYEDPQVANRIESNMLYELIEKEVAPLFYNRGRDGLPRGWIKKMKSCMNNLGRFFNTIRMLQEYTNGLYLPASRKYFDLAANKYERAKALADWKSNLSREWNKVAVREINHSTDDQEVGNEFSVEAKVELAGLKPQDVTVEIYYGHTDSKGDVINANIIPMAAGGNQGSLYTYSGKITCKVSGRFGFAIRILPRHPDLCHSYLSGFIHWAQ